MCTFVTSSFSRISIFSYLMVSSEIKFPYIPESSMTRTPFLLVLVLRIIYLWSPAAAICLRGDRNSITSCLMILSSYK
jgi:hypothetical protein